MSADNGIYILKTRRERGRWEYRVAHCQAIGNIAWRPNYPAQNPQLNRQSLYDLFGRCKVFNDLKIAQGYAMRMAEEIDVLEYGVAVLDYGGIWFPGREALTPVAL